MKKYKPTTPGQRGMTMVDRSILTKKKPERKLLLSLKKTGGRGAGGRIAIRHRGGGVKRLYRIIDFGPKKFDIKAKVISLEYDPNRTAFIALLQYEDGERIYILAPQNLKVGDEIISSTIAPISPGNRMELKNIPVGTMVYDIELEPQKGGKLVRSAGTSAQVMSQEEKYTHLKMPSGEIRKINNQCFASIGIVSNIEHRYRKIGKAGRRRLKGKRPRVRGVAMNPPDHPHGGGEGRSPVGLKHQKTPWGKIAFGVKTRKKRKWTDKFIIRRRRKKKRK